MKQGIMRKTAILLIITFMAGVLCALATIRAMASNPGGNSSVYSDDLREFFLEIKPNQANEINNFFDLLDTALDPDNNYVVFACFNDGDWIIDIYNGDRNNKVWYSYVDQYGGSGVSRTLAWQDINVIRVAYLFYNGTLSFGNDFSQYGFLMPYAFNFNNPSDFAYNFFPNIYDDQSADMYSSRDILPGGGFTMTANFFAGSSEPLILPFTLVSFQIGDRYFITIQDQSLFANFKPVTEDGEYFWELKYNVNFPTDDDAVYPNTILWAMLYRLSADLAQYVPNVQNVGYFLYAYEITDLVQSGVYFTIDSGEIWSIYVAQGGGRTDTLLYQSDSVLSFNSPYEPEEPTQQDQSWVNFTNYYNTYNTTHIVPTNLGEILYGLEGSMTMPVDVAAPRSLINSGEEYATNVFKYHLLFNDNLAFNTDLLDVVIFENNEPVNFNLRYWYNDTLDPKFRHVDWYTFNSLIQEFDLIIIINDDKGMLTDDTNSIAYCGSFTGGIEYTDNPINTSLGNTMSGFAFVTHRGIQKQLLFNFNDGITKTYQLMCDYIDKRGDWDDSFLLWSASIFQQLDTCNGKLENIKNAIIDLNAVVASIKEAVNKIALDPDPDNTSPWYLSLWNFITQFEPSNDQISDAIDLLDDNLDDIPLLPALTPVPALPTLGG